MLLRKVSLSLINQLPANTLFFQLFFLCCLATSCLAQEEATEAGDTHGSPRGQPDTTVSPFEESTRFELSDNEKAMLAEIVVDLESELLRVNNTHLASSIEDEYSSGDYIDYAEFEDYEAYQFDYPLTAPLTPLVICPCP